MGKSTKDDKTYTIKLPDGELYEIPEDFIVRVHPQDEIGVDIGHILTAY